MTVHAAAWMVVRKFHLAAGFSAPPEVLSSTLPLVREGLSGSPLVRCLPPSSPILPPNSSGSLRLV